MYDILTGLPLILAGVNFGKLFTIRIASSEINSSAPRTTLA